MTDSKNLFFLTLSLICFWLVLDSFVGKKYIASFVGSFFNDSNNSGGTSVDSDGFSGSGGKF